MSTIENRKDLFDDELINIDPEEEKVFPFDYEIERQGSYIRNYNESQKRLEEAGYERHLSFKEQMALFIKKYRYELNYDLESLVNNLRWEGEFCNQAIQWL